MRIVHSIDELLELPRDRAINGLRARQLVRLEIPALAPRVQAGAQLALNSLQQRCGSFASTGGMLLTLAFGIVLVFQRNATLFSWSALPWLVLVLVAAFASGGIARLLALEITRWQFAHRCRVQHRLLSMQLHPAG